MTDRSALRKLASEATAGPWGYDGVDVFTLTDSGQGYPLDRYPDSADVVIGKCPDCGSRMVGVVHIADEHFIAAANPQNVINLLDQLDRADAERADLIKAIRAKGQPK